MSIPEDDFDYRLFAEVNFEVERLKHKSQTFYVHVGNSEGAGYLHESIVWDFQTESDAQAYVVALPDNKKGYVNQIPRLEVLFAEHMLHQASYNIGRLIEKEGLSWLQAMSEIPFLSPHPEVVRWLKAYESMYGDVGFCYEVERVTD